MSTIKFDEGDTPELKKWLVTRLEDISDADSDVLADYVLALIKSDEPDDVTRANCIDNLEDFLRDHTKTFVDDVFATIRSKSFKHNHAPSTSSAGPASFQSQTTPSVATGGPQAIMSPVSPLEAPSGPFAPPTGPSFSAYGGIQDMNGFNSRGDQSKKRSYNDREGSDGYSGNIGERAIKQMRRGGPNTRGGRGGAAANGFHYPPQMPSPPPGFPPLDPNNPMAALMAMQAMGMPPMPGLGPFPGPTTGQTNVKINQRCMDYDTKGFCAAGSECPYEHGDDHIVVGQQGAKDLEDKSRQYDPNFPQQQSLRGNMRSTPRGNRGRGRGGMNSNRGGRRASFSSPAQNHDTRITSIVIEQIPEEKFSAEEVRTFFEEFGPIEDIDMQAYKRLAVVKYKDYESARKAYDSPKVVFDNRFVKVYWYKPASAQNGHKGAHGKQNSSVEPKPEDEEMIDPEEFAKKQAEAQRAHEEKAKKLKDAETAKEELDKRIKAQAEERRKLMEKLASKTEPAKTPSAQAANTPAPSGVAGSPAPSNTANGNTQSAKEKATEALRAKLAELEAEAENLGLAPEDSNVPPYSPAQYAPPPFQRGRGGYRGWRGFDPSFRGGGRGGWRGGHGGGAVARLDNRPKSVSVTALDEGVDFGSEVVGEALRSHLYSIGSFASIQPPPSDTHGADDANDGSGGPQKTTIVTFHERYVAEIFITSAKHTSGAIPGIGKVELQWVPNANVPTPTSAQITGAQGASAGEGVAATGKGDVDSASGPDHADVSMRGTADAVDYDVADDADEDRWMVT